MHKEDVALILGGIVIVVVTGVAIVHDILVINQTSISRREMQVERACVANDALLPKCEACGK